MTKQQTLVTAGVFSLLALLGPFPAREARGQVVFQAAGPNAASIQGTVDAFRAALGNPNNANNPGPIATGRREINWDGGGVDTTTGPDNPFTVFQNSRGALFTTPGIGLSQAPPSGGAQGGLATLFGNPSYGTTFGTFSSPRLFTPVGSRITDGSFSVPGTGGATAAAVTGFGAVFTDVDKPDGVERTLRTTTQIQYFDADDNLIFTGFVPSSPGNASLSFFGVMFPDARIARVRIRTGDVPPGPDDGAKDIVMMDDFLYGEPQALSVP